MQGEEQPGYSNCAYLFIDQRLLVLKQIAIFTIQIFDIKTNKYPILLFFNNILIINQTITKIDCRST